MLAPLLRSWRHRPTHRRVWALAAPMMLSNLSVPLVSLVDSIVAGHLPQAGQLAAVAVGSAVFTLPVWLCGFVRMSTTGLAAQAHGHGHAGQVHTVLLQALLLAVVLSLLLLAITWPLLPWVLTLMQAEPTLHELALEYLHVRLFALPAALANYALAGWFLGRQNARVALGIVLTTNLVNIVLNLVFVYAFHGGSTAIAWASLAGAWAGTGFGLVCAWRAWRRRPGRLDLRPLRQWCQWHPLLAVNRDIFLRSLALQGVYFALATLGTRLGAEVVAANTLLLNGLMLTSFALDGLANAIEAVSGHAIGAGNRNELRRVLVVAGGWSLLGSLGFALLFALAGHVFIDLQTDLPRVREVAYAGLPWLALLPLVAVWSYLLDGLFIGATRARGMRDTMVLSGLGFAALCWALQAWGNTGLWLALLGFMALRGASMGVLAWHIERRDGWIGPQPPNARMHGT